MRPQGKLLLEAAKQRRFDAVVVYSVDRLVRSLSVLMEVYAQLSEWGVDIKSATEPFDTSTPFGRFLFQFLGSMAEFQRSAILERLVMGRDRIVREGKWTHGPVPLGYELDEDQRLAPSTRKVDGTGQTEAEYVRGLFHGWPRGAPL
jgi:site-specific DNA recombinase